MKTGLPSRGIPPDSHIPWKAGEKPLKNGREGKIRVRPK